MTMEGKDWSTKAKTNPCWSTAALFASHRHSEAWYGPCQLTAASIVQCRWNSHPCHAHRKSHAATCFSLAINHAGMKGSDHPYTEPQQELVPLSLGSAGSSRFGISSSFCLAVSF